MGLFDSIVGAIEGQAGAGGQGNLMESVMGLINHPDMGGLGGLVQKLEQSGLGPQVASWVSNGSNLPVTAEQIQSALNSPALQGIAAQFGLHSGDVANQLASLLPQVINHLTPNGHVPAQGDLTQEVLSGLSGLFGNKQ
ncbi:MAG: YidB family protein [Gallionella sp.]